MLNKIFSKTTIAAFLTSAALLSATSSPAHAYHGYYGYHGHHGYWRHHGFGNSFGRGLGYGVGAGLGAGLVNYALRRNSYGYGHPYRGTVVENSQTIIYNAPPAPALPPAYPYPVPGYTTYTTGYGYTSGPITVPPNFY